MTSTLTRLHCISGITRLEVNAVAQPVRALQVMPYSTGCTTPLSNFEAGLNYKDVPDPAVKVSFPLDDDEHNAEIVIWTTTPW